MNKSFLCTISILFTLLLGACASPSLKSPTPAPRVLKPGDPVEDMILAQGNPTLPYLSIWEFCEPMPDNYEPATTKTECTVPLLSGMAIEIGWFAKETKFSFNWDSLSWEVTIDGYMIDLEAFEWSESIFTKHGEDNKLRVWQLNLKPLSPGEHKLMISQTMDTDVDDGFDLYRAGVYEHTVNFTVSDKTVYPELSSAVSYGQNSYTSEKAGLDFLLYLPGDYGKDPQQEWPLIVYLHGASLRGATLELLAEAPLPRKVARDDQFPFIVLSPLGDGEYEFWAQDQMIDPLFKLLEEIQATYSIDDKRIYLTGNDMGGNGVWKIGLQHPEFFAALAPVAGYFSYPFETPVNICDLKDVPVWSFHGKLDEYVPVEVAQELVDALIACGGNAKITISQEMKNDIPFNAYANPALYNWLLEQSRK